MCPYGSLKEDDPLHLCCLLSTAHCLTAMACLQGQWEGLCAHRHGRRLVLHLLSPGSSKHVPASTQAFIHMPTKTASQIEEAPDAEVAPAKVEAQDAEVAPAKVGPSLT